MISTRTRRITGVALASLVAVAGLVAASGQATASTEDESPTFQPTCTPLPSAPQTSQADVDTGQAVTVLHWSLPDLDVAQVIPPTGWSPLQASDADLEEYGFRVRPTDPAALADWNEEFSPPNFSHVAAIRPGQMCNTGVVAGGSGLVQPDIDTNDVAGTADPGTVGAPQSSQNWGGIVDNGNGFNYVYGRMAEDTATNCNGNDIHFTWVGLGGWNGNQSLLQNGTGQQAPIGSDYAWYEAISAQHLNPSVSLGSAFPISAGDTVAMSTHWYGGSNAHAVFYWHNYRTGTVITVRINDKSVAGDLSSNHDGTSAEVIDERGAFYNSSDKSWYYAKLRQHTTTHWTHAVSARGSSGNQAVRSRPHTWLQITQTARAPARCSRSGTTARAPVRTSTTTGTTAAPS